MRIRVLFLTISTCIFSTAAFSKAIQRADKQLWRAVQLVGQVAPNMQNIIGHPPALCRSIPRSAHAANNNGYTLYAQKRAAASPGGFKSAAAGEGDKPVIKEASKGEWQDTWTEEGVFKPLAEEPASKLLTAEIDEQDLQKIGCPGYKSLGEEDKKKFWAVMMGSMSHYEGEHKPDEYFDEPGGDGESMNDSYGLLQIDAANAGAAGCVKEDGSKPEGGKLGKEGGGDMYDPVVNLRCGLAMVNKQLERKNGKIFDDGSYWAIFREGRPAEEKFSKLVVEEMKQIEACQGVGGSSPTGSAAPTEA
ncbi:hypothetical protein N9O57_00995 [bacterium]|nr:hypothetical protein [bacterium]